MNEIERHCETVREFIKDSPNRQKHFDDVWSFSKKLVNDDSVKAYDIVRELHNYNLMWYGMSLTVIPRPEEVGSKNTEEVY